jgi:beta-xylosidase
MGPDLNYKELTMSTRTGRRRAVLALGALAALSMALVADSRALGDPIIASIYTADPSAHVFGGALYVYPSHDVQKDKVYKGDGDQYDMDDYHVLSMTDPLGAAKDNGVALALKDVPWAAQQLWAPDAAFKNGTYYLYFPAKDKEGIFRIGIATSSSPTGPFKANPKPIEGSFSIDPAVFTDEDGKTYMLFGGLWGGQLEKWQTGVYKAEGQAPGGADKALGPRIALMGADMASFAGPAKEISIVDETGAPLAASRESRRFFEAVWLHKYKGTYYLSYSTGTTHNLVYATSAKIEGPYLYRGKILDPVKGWTTHHSIVQYKGKWYLFYHDASLSGVDSLRCVKSAELFYESDGSIRKVMP